MESVLNQVDATEQRRIFLGREAVESLLTTAENLWAMGHQIQGEQLSNEESQHFGKALKEACNNIDSMARVALQAIEHRDGIGFGLSDSQTDDTGHEAR